MQLVTCWFPENDLLDNDFRSATRKMRKNKIYNNFYDVIPVAETRVNYHSYNFPFSLAGNSSYENGRPNREGSWSPGLCKAAPRSFYPRQSMT